MLFDGHKAGSRGQLLGSGGGGVGGVRGAVLDKGGRGEVWLGLGAERGIGDVGGDVWVDSGVVWLGLWAVGKDEVGGREVVWLVSWAGPGVGNVGRDVWEGREVLGLGLRLRLRVGDVGRNV